MSLNPMKNIVIIVLFALSTSLGIAIVFVYQGYQRLNDEYWLTKADTYAMHQRFQSESLRSGSPQNPEYIDWLKNEASLIEQCFLSQCISAEALEQMNQRLLVR